MREARPSLTALRVAIRRAAHQLFDRPLVFEDPVALRIIGSDRASDIAANPEKEADPYSRSLRAFLVIRSRLAEDQLDVAIRRGVRQYVILGAGLDTFAYRNQRVDLQVFEVDHPATQAWKRQLLEDAGIGVPETLRYVPVDFERDSLGASLEPAGLDRSRATFVSWLGVVPYLEADAVFATLGLLARLASGGGGLVFDYALPPDTLPPERRAVFDAIAARVARAGEPWISFFEPESLAERLRALGFRDIDDLDANALNERYLAGRADGLRVHGLGRVLTAVS